LNGNSSRKALFISEIIIVPHLILDKPKGEVTKFFNCLKELCAISYFSRYYQECSKIRARCWALSFLLPKYIIYLFGDAGKKLFDNHLHKILRHLSEYFEDGPFDEMSCEPFEAYIARILKINTNNQKIHAIFKLLETAHEDKHTPTVRVDYGKNKNDLKKIWLQEYV